VPRARSVRFGVVVTAVAMVALVGACGGSRSASPGPGPVGPDTKVVAKIAGRWKPVLDENFSGTSLNPNLWQPDWFGDTVPVNATDGDLSCLSTSQVKVADGMLQLTTKRQNSACGYGSNLVSHRYVSAMVSSNPAENALGPGKGFAFTYGLIEFRAKIPADSNGNCADWSVLWTAGQSWPNTGEMDAFECLGSESTWALHSGRTGGAYPYIPGYPTGNYTGWHTFAIDWEPDVATVYFDGREVGAHNYIQPSPNYIAISNTVRAKAKVVLPTTLDVDWVRVWQHSSAPSARPMTVSAAGIALAPRGAGGPAT
jgi:beta-glucanase (GH16 family)